MSALILYTGSEIQKKKKKKAKWDSLASNLGLTWVRLWPNMNFPVFRIYLIKSHGLFCSIAKLAFVQIKMGKTVAAGLGKSQ